MTADPVLSRLAELLARPPVLTGEVLKARKRGIGIHGSSKKHDFGTPAHIFDPIHAEFAFDFDAAANARNAKLPRFISPDENALIVPWSDFGRRAWLNPPYGRQLIRFLRRVVEVKNDEGILSVTLTPARTDTEWFHDVILRSAAEVWFLKGRIVFDGAPLGKDGRRLGAPFPSLITVFDPAFTGSAPRLYTWDPLEGTPRKEITLCE